MDLIKKVEAIDFSRVLRGYDVEEVDAFHAELVRELSEMSPDDSSESQRGHQPASEPDSGLSRSKATGLYDPEGAVQRVLAVAQRTADEVISEAQAEATRLVGDAQLRHDKINADADQARRLIVTEAAAEAKRVAEATREPLVAEIASLEERRDALQTDLDALDVHFAGERERMGESVARLNEILDNPADFRIGRGPESTVPDVPLDSSDSDDNSEPESIDEPAADRNDNPAPDDDEIVADVSDQTDSSERAAEVPPDDNVASAGSGLVDDTESSGSDSTAMSSEGSNAVQSEPELDPPPEASVTDLDVARNEVFQPADSPLPEPEQVASPYPDEPAAVASLPWDDKTDDASGGPPTEGVLIDDLLGGENEGDDRFLDELRRATENDFGEDDGDEAIAAFFDQDEEKKKKKGRKRQK